MQNFAARILTNTSKFDHISPVVNELGWLTIDKLLTLRDVTMIYKCISGLAPTYLYSKLLSDLIYTHIIRDIKNISVYLCVEHLWHNVVFTTEL